MAAQRPISLIAAVALPASPTYARHAPERTLLYALVQAHYPDVLARLDSEDRFYPAQAVYEAMPWLNI